MTFCFFLVRGAGGGLISKLCFVTPWTVTHQTPQSVGLRSILQARILKFVVISPPRDLPDPWIKHRSPAHSLLTEPMELTATRALRGAIFHQF